MMYSDIRRRKLETFMIVIAFIAFLTALIYAVSLFFEETTTSLIIPIAVMIATFTAVFSYYNSDKIVLKLNNARPANRNEDLELKSLLEGIVIATGLPMPKLYVMDDMSLNAFATGRNPSNAVICVTTGLLQKLDKYEIEGVLAHELSHIKNYDMLVATIISVMVGFVVILSDIVSRSLFWGRGRRSNDRDEGNGIIQIIALIFIILSPIFANLMKLLISRKREYLADASAVSITRNKEAMISALSKISGDNVTYKSPNGSTAHILFSEPVLNAKSKKKDGLFSTHPTIENRIKALRELN